MNNNVILKVKRLNQFATLPTKAHWDDLGYDLYSSDRIEISPHGTSLIPTGIACQFPVGYGAIIKDRSSIASKRRLFTAAGVIDSGYRGEIKICLYNSTNELYVVGPGEKIAQMILCPVISGNVEEIDELDITSRSDKGFGSSDG